MNEKLREYLVTLFAESELNRLPDGFGGGRIFSSPLVGVAGGDDPIFKKFKEVVTPEHLTPAEMWLANGLPDGPNLASRLRTVSIICPFVKEIRDAGKNAKELPPDIYSVGRNHANAFKIDVINNLIKFFQDQGYQATAGMTSRSFNIFRSLRSTWSERHIAFAAGLGTFSLHEALITEVGCNVRICSVITDAPLEIDPRKSDEPYANCLFYTKGTCKKCIERCPAGAITEEGHNKIECFLYGQKVARKLIKRLKLILKPHHRRIEGQYMEVKPPVGCALCQFGVPCMDKNPTLKEQK